MRKDRHRKNYYKEYKRPDKDYFKKYYGRPEVVEKRRKRKIKFDLFIENFKKDKCCVKCGWKDHPEILQFHHKNPKEKERNIPNMMNCSKENIQKEMEKCELLCPNCHFWIHYNFEENSNI